MSVCHASLGHPTVIDIEVRWAGEPDVVMQLSGIPGAAVAVRTCQVRRLGRLVRLKGQKLVLDGSGRAHLPGRLVGAASGVGRRWLCCCATAAAAAAVAAAAKAAAAAAGEWQALLSGATPSPCTRPCCHVSAMPRVVLSVVEDQYRPTITCPSALSSCQVSGMLRVVLSPIEEELPFVTGITLSLLERPYLDFDVR